MSEKELRDFKGMLIRDYNDIIRCVQKCRETLAQTLNKIARQEAFQDASYKTPLENMLKVCDNAAKVLRQLIKDSDAAFVESFSKKFMISR